MLNIKMDITILLIYVMHFFRSTHVFGNKKPCKLAQKVLNVVCKYLKNNILGLLSFIMSTENKSFSTIILILYKMPFW